MSNILPKPYGNWVRGGNIIILFKDWKMIIWIKQ